MSIAGLYTLICWGRFDIRLRYLTLLFPIGAFLLCAVLDRFFYGRDEEAPNSMLTKSIPVVIISLTVALNLYHIFGYVSIKEPFPFLTGKISKEQYIKKHYKQYSMFKFINNNVTAGDALIYFLDFGNDGYYCDVDYIYDSIFLGRTFEAVVKKSKDSDEIFRRLKEKGITHILLNIKFLKEDLANNYNNEEKGKIDNFFSKYLNMVKEFGDDKFFKLNEN
jgi:hypothetical protein